MKVRIKKLPRSYKLQGRKLVKKSHGGRTGDQFDYGLTGLPGDMVGGHFHNDMVPTRVNNTLGPIPREQANVEAEAGETALTDLNQDGTFELYNISGNRHSSGGTPLNLPEQSFIYSDTRAMKLNKAELAELGIESKKKLTPADVSKKFPLNKYYETLDNVDGSDHIAIDTAESMLETNKLKLSHLAYLQEAKKSFDEGVPSAAFPYLKKKGIDPIEFTAKIEGISKEEAEMKQIMSMPVDVQQKVMQLKEMIAMADQQAQQPPQVGPQGEPMQGPPQGMAQGMPPQGPPQGMPPQGMMPPPEMMARYGGYVPNYYAYGGDLPQAGWGKSLLDWGQGALSVAGMVPGVGLIADAANTAISGGRAAYAGYTGDKEGQKKHLGNMALNATAMIPGVGQIATAGKAGKGFMAAAKTKTLGKTAGLVGDFSKGTAAGLKETGKNLGKTYGKKVTETLSGDLAQGVNLGKKGIAAVDETTGTVDTLAGTDIGTDIGGSVKKGIGTGIVAAADTVTGGGTEQPQLADNATDPVTQQSTTEQVTDPSTGGVEETVASTAEATQEAEQSATPEATTVSATTPSMEAESEEMTLNDQEEEEAPAEDVVADSSDMEEEAEEEMAYEPQSGGEEEEYVPQSQRAMYGGDPFAQNDLREFIYGGVPKYQNGSEVALHESGVSQTQADAWLTQGYSYGDTDGDGNKEWTHPNYSQSEINNQVRDAKTHVVTGTQGVGDEGIEDYQGGRGREDGDGYVYTGAEGDEFDYDDFMSRHGNLIGEIDADGDGVPDYQDTEFDIYNAEHTGAFQDAYNAKLVERYENDPTLQEEYDSADAYLEATGGFHGEGKTAADDMFGEYTYSRTSLDEFPEEEEEDPCPPEVKETKMAECAEQGLPFDEAACDCGQAAESDCENEEEKKAQCDEEGGVWDSANCVCQAGPEDVEETDEADPEFWLQDRLGIMNAIDNKFRIKKRYPWTPIEESQSIDPVFQDPTRAIAAIGEQANAAAQTASAFSGPQRAAAVQAKAQGAAAEQIANVSAQVQGANVGIANDAQKTNAMFAADTERVNKANLKKLYDDTMLVEQNYDNAISKANTELTKQIQNAYTNRADTHNLNSLYPQFNIDPRTGGLIELTNERTNEPTQRSDGDKAAEYKQLIAQCADSNASGTCPDDMQKVIWKQVYGSGGGSTTTTDDSWKDVALNQGTEPVQQRFGGERKMRLNKKAKQLRKWFSPLQGKNAY